jgi:site-specific DNA recombinase
MRAVIYARYSSENQNETSIEDQVRDCQRLIEDQGWQLEEVYSDRGISGATSLRAGYQRLLSDARTRAIDVVVTEGLDRLSRDQETIAGLFKQLSFLGIAIVTRAEGQVNELHVGLKGTMNALFLKDLAIKTHRGLEGRVRQGKSGGGRAYGYRVARQKDTSGEDVRGLRAIEPSEAEVVRRVFREFAAGKSPRAIAQGLNIDGIPGPSGNSWRDTTIRGHATRRTGILRNDLYVGRLIWNKQKYVRDPSTGKRLARVRDSGEHIVAEVPTLRIVDQDIWNAVQERLDTVRSSARIAKVRKAHFWKFRRPKHLLTGLVKCGSCGGAMEAVGKDYLACRAARSGARCFNRRSIKRIRVEEVVLEGLKNRLMAPELVEEFIRAYHEELNRNNATDELQRDLKQQQLGGVTRKLRGLYDAIADGLRSPGLQKELLDLERRQAELRGAVEAAPPPAPRSHPKLADVYRQQVSELHVALNDPEARIEAVEILRTLIERITVRADGDSHVVVLTGDIVKLLALPGNQVPAAFESSVKVVAGVGFEPTTFQFSRDSASDCIVQYRSARS